MQQARLWLTVMFLGFWPWAISMAQNPTDPSTLRFIYSLETDREKMLVHAQRGAAEALLDAAREIVALPDNAGSRTVALLGEIQHLADSIANLDSDIADARTALGQASRALIDALESNRLAVHREEVDADPRRHSQLDSLVAMLNAEIRDLRDAESRHRAKHPLASETPVIDAVLRIAAEERARLRTMQRLRDEIGLFLGNLRLYDETGMPPSVRSEAGGEPDPSVGCGCGLPQSPPTMGSPADIPMDHFRPGGSDNAASDAEFAVTPSSLSRLQEQLVSSAGVSEYRINARDLEGGASVNRAMTLGISLLTYRGEGNGTAGGRLGAGASFVVTHALGNRVQLTLEPRLGGRAVQLDPGSSAELAGEIREAVVGTVGSGWMRWQVSAWQKGRFLSDPLPLPAYLEPGRAEGGATGRTAISPFRGWDVELGGGGDVVRYGAEDWKPFDRHGYNAFLAVARRWSKGAGRLSLLSSRHRFSGDMEPIREDSRVGVGGEWSMESRVVVRLTAAVSWNDSRLPAYDYRSGRFALVLSVPWHGGSVLGYGALSHRSYLNPGPVDARVAPSDQETGSIVALQFTRPVAGNHAVTFRAEWSRSETGFRNDFYQRLALGVEVSFRGMDGP